MNSKRNRKPSTPTSIETFIGDLTRLTAPEVLGYYNYCEVTEVVAFAPDRSRVNLFTIIVFEESARDPNSKPVALNPERITLPKLKDWFFGVFRYSVNPDRLNRALKHLSQNKEWLLNENALNVGTLVPTRQQYVPPDSTKQSPLNRILKNNFWNGSYVFELFDLEKPHIEPLLQNPSLLAHLSASIQEIIPLKLASLADRLGNVLIQLPVKVLMSEFSFWEDKGMKVTLAWDQRAKPRTCRMITQMEYDGAILGFGDSLVPDGSLEISTLDSTQINRNYIWDEMNHLILAASGPIAAIRNISIRPSIMNPEPRTIVISRRDGTFKSDRIQVISKVDENTVGANDPFAYRKWINGRIYSEERRRLEQERTFVQYGLSADKQAERNKALADLRYLLNQHGENGAWLWDPF